MDTKYAFSYSVDDINQNIEIGKLLILWASQQDQKDWKRHGYSPGHQNSTTCLTFNFFVMTKSNLSVEQVDEIIKILTDQGAKAISIQIIPTPPK